MFSSLCLFAYSSEPAANYPECSSKAGHPAPLKPPEPGRHGREQPDETAAAAAGERETET